VGRASRQLFRFCERPPTIATALVVGDLKVWVFGPVVLPSRRVWRGGLWEGIPVVPRQLPVPGFGRCQAHDRVDIFHQVSICAGDNFPVTTSRKDTKIEFRVARPDQTDNVLSVLNEAAAWLQERGITQWPARFERSWIDEAVCRGETWLVEVDGTVCATVTVDWSDPVWNDTDGSAAYIHRMAVRRQRPGLGAIILAWVADFARQHGRDTLRLDCVASNGPLRAYYERAGFVYRGDVAVGGAPGQRLDRGPTTWVSRYEMSLGSRHEQR
jgi:GNAT superfamily N-acetyltransferase